MLVRTMEASMKEVSLLELFEHAHEYQALAGELPTQDVAVLRMLLAVLHTVFSRVDAEGRAAPLEDADEEEGLMRWKALWENKRFPMEPIQVYLKQVEDRFWLFDEKNPFYQFPAAKKIAGLNNKGQLKCRAVKLNAAVNQSENKGRIFVEREGVEKESLTYAEAARWLIHNVAYDDCAVKKSDAYKKKNLTEEESPGTGWLGKLGVVYAQGENLFETLMLNLVMWPNGEYMEAARECPIWEQDSKEVREREKVPWPDNMAALLTFPSRCLLLERENGRVIGSYPVYGMFFDSATPMEQMTVRNGSHNPKKEPYQPRIHDRGSFLWQEFASVFSAGTENEEYCPGVVRWINLLQELQLGVDRDKLLRFQSVGIYYDSNKSSIEQIEADELSLHAGVVSGLGREWRNVIADEIALSEKAAYLVGRLAKEIYMASSGRAADKRKKADPVLDAEKQGKSIFYETMDLPFRQWLLSISAEDTDTEEKRREWRITLHTIAKQIGRNLAERAGPAAYVGHTICEKEDGSGEFYSTAKSYAKFTQKLHNVR